jgi:hypothetical protein
LSQSSLFFVKISEAAQIEAAIGIAKNLIAKGMDDTFISEVTNLNAIQIQALRKS